MYFFNFLFSLPTRVKKSYAAMENAEVKTEDTETV